MKSDIEIAQEAVMQPIKEVAAAYGIGEDDLELYGKYKAKLHFFVRNQASGHQYFICQQVWFYDLCIDFQCALLVFWMVIVFGIVFVILAKYGFPVITRMVH